MYRIPAGRKWVQSGDSDISGSLFSSFNSDVSDNVGRLRIGSRVVINTSSSDDADIGVPVAVKSLGSVNYMIAGSKVFKSVLNTPQSSFSEDVTSGVPTTLSSSYSDMTDFNGYLYVTANSTTVYKTDGSTWSSFTAGSNSGAVRLLMQYGDRMYMSDGYGKIISWSTSDTVATSGQYTLDFSSNTNSRRITFMRAGANRVWIGTMNVNGGKGTIYEWNGSDTQPSKSYRLEASGALSCVIKDDIPWVIDSNGSLLAYNGGSFQYITRFNRQAGKIMYGALNTDPTTRFVHHNGMSVIEGDIHALIKGTSYDSAETIDDSIPSGIWQYAGKSGMIHKHSLSLGKSGDSITDYGQIKISKVGVLSENNVPSNSGTRNGTFLAGAEIYTNSSSTKAAIFYDDSNETLQKSSIIITPKMDSQNVDDVWQKMFVKHSRLLSASDKIVAKYRTAEYDPVEATITWTSTTTLTTTADLSSFAVGDEMTVIQGIGSGKPSHVTAISYSAPTYSLTVDEAYSGATGTSKAKFDKWTKCGSLSNLVATYLECPIGRASNWIQAKIWSLRTGRNSETEEILISSAPNKTIN